MGWQKMRRGQVWRRTFPVPLPGRGNWAPGGGKHADQMDSTPRLLITLRLQVHSALASGSSEDYDGVGHQTSHRVIMPPLWRVHCTVIAPNLKEQPNGTEQPAEKGQQQVAANELVTTATL